MYAVRKIHFVIHGYSYYLLLLLSLLPIVTVVVHGLSLSLPPLTVSKEHIPLAREALGYFDASPDPFHAVQSSADMLSAVGFEELDEQKPYTTQIQPGRAKPL